MSLLDLLGDREVWVIGKGGIGKSTTAAALGHHYAKKGEQVLCFDVDGYHSMPDALGLRKQDCERFLVPENKVYSLHDEIGLDLDICLVSPREIVSYVRNNRKTNPSSRTDGLPQYFGILHFYDVLEQLGVLTANEDLASLSLICAERMVRLKSFKNILEKETDKSKVRPVRFVYDTQSSNAAISLLERASQCVTRLRVMKEHKFRWSTGLKLAGWSDLGAFVKDSYVYEIEQHIDSFQNLYEDIHNPEKSACLVVTGARRTELTETIRLIDELEEMKFPATAILVNRYDETSYRENLTDFRRNTNAIPIYYTPDLPIFESSSQKLKCLTEFVESIAEIPKEKFDIL